MTLGDGILWSTVLILLAAGIYLLSIRKKWRTFGKVLGALILIGAVIGGGIWGYFQYQNRPMIIDEIDGVSVSMTMLEVKLGKGKPDLETTPNPQGDSGISTVSWLYGGGDYQAELWVVFAGKSEDDYRVLRVCEKGGYTDLLGFGRYDSEQSIVEKLGEPTSVSIEASGIKKFMNYEPWQVSYEVQERKVTMVCVSMLGQMIYNDEYGEEPDPE